jgi:hypothetical protein
MELSIDPESAWEPRRGFFGLPPELRDVIYNMVLIEPPKWERRHSPLCDLCPRHTNKFERPVFDDQLTRCTTCKLRQNTGLLLANRQVHRETASIFWSRNTFCFRTATEFAKDVGKVLRPEYRQLLQHVSILRVNWQVYQIGWLRAHGERRGAIDVGTEGMWNALLQCTALRRVEIGAEHVFRVWPDGQADDFTGLISTLREKLPSLQEFAFANFLVYDVNGSTSRIDPLVHYWDLPPMHHRQLLYVKVKKVLDLNMITTAERAREALRDFVTNFTVHIRFALETTLLGVAEGDFSTDPNEPYAAGFALASDFDDTNLRQELKLRDGTTTRVQLLGLPISAQTRIRHVKERWREDARRKLAGQPTVWEEKFKAIVQERQEEKKVQRVAEASKEFQARIEARELRREVAEKEEQKRQRRAKARERAKLARSEQLAQETRQVERKRVRGRK